MSTKCNDNAYWPSSVISYCSDKLFCLEYNKFITSWTIMFNETTFWEMFLQLQLQFLNLLYYERWTDKRKYFYIYFVYAYLKEHYIKQRKITELHWYWSQS